MKHAKILKLNNTGIQGIGYNESENSSKVNHGCWFGK